MVRKMTMNVGHGRLVLVTKGDNAAVQHLAVLEDRQGKLFASGGSSARPSNEKHRYSIFGSSLVLAELTL